METNILNQLGVGSIIYHRSLGVLVITEKLAPQNEGVGFRMHGQRLFYMEKLIDSRPEENTRWILYSSSIDEGEVSLASDKQIEENIEFWLSSHSLGPETSLWIDNDGITISADEDYIRLSPDQTAKLVKLLKERVYLL